MVNRKSYFDSLNKIDTVKIAVAKDGESLVANQHGDIVIKTFHNGDCLAKTICDVLFVDKLKCNLLSIRKLVEKGFKIVFSDQIAYISKNNNVKFVARLKGKLYEVVFYLEKSVFAGHTSEKTIQNVSQELWHFRLGHLNAADMKRLIVNKMVCGLEKVNINNESKFCESCTIGKQTRLPFPKNKHLRSSRILELVHTDVCGPMSEPAWDNSRYVLTFTDDFSRATKVYCIERKSDVVTKFKEFVVMVETQHRAKIVKLKADNGGEYSSNEFKQFCKSKGIQLIYTVPHNPEMNSVAERVNRTLIERARTMLLASGLERRFWNEAVLAASYIKNRCPTIAFGKQFVSKTPAEIWFGSKPDLANLRIFGSTCYNHVPASNRTKFDGKASKCIILGYGSSMHSYRL